MATDGQVDTNDNVRGGRMQSPGKSLPPWMNKGKAKEKGMDRKAARGAAIERRLKAMGGKKGPGPGEFGGPADGVHTKKTGK
jgi:hypothetical protein